MRQYNLTNTPHVFHVEATWTRLFPLCFNVEYTWYDCREEDFLFQAKVEIFIDFYAVEEQSKMTRQQFFVTDIRLSLKSSSLSPHIWFYSLK